MKDAQGTSLQTTTNEPSSLALPGNDQEPPRYRVRRPVPPPTTPTGIARTVATLLALPIRVVLELGIETARTLSSAFSVRSQDR
jgi:hypothetical protein